MDLSRNQRVTLRISTDEWTHVSKLGVQTCGILCRKGLMEAKPGKPHIVRLTEKGTFYRDRLPPEPRPEWHDPAWRRRYWGEDIEASPVEVSETESRANGWPLGPWPWEPSDRQA